MLPSLALAVLAVAASPAVAQLAQMRGTIPGSLHQCEDTSMVFFQTGGERPLDVLFLPSAQVPASLRTGTTTLEEAQRYSPLQAVPGLTAADNDAAPLQIQMEQGQVFEVFGFLPDGSGKALSLTRTVMTPLPGATNCLRNVQTAIGGAAAAPATTAAPESTRGPRTSAAAAASSAVAPAASGAASASSAASSVQSSAAAPSSASNTGSAAAASGSSSTTSGAILSSTTGSWAVGLGGLGALVELFLF